MASTQLSHLVTRGIIFLLTVAAIALVAYPRVRHFFGHGDDVEKFHADTNLLEKLGQAKLTPEPASQTADWPQWRGPHRDGISAETGLLASWPKAGPTVVWKVPGGAGHSSFAVTGGRVYTLLQDGDDEVIVCLDAAKGTDIWRHRYPGKFYESYAGPGPHATPTVDDGRVYAVGAMGLFHCLDAASGKVLWKHNLHEMFNAPKQDYGTSFSPLIEGELVITLPGGPDGASIAAFDRKDGRLVWKASNDKPGYSSPIAATIGGKRQLVVVTGESVIGLSPADGAIYWRFPWTTHLNCNIATPIVVGDYVFVSSGYGKGCGLFHIATSDQGQSAAPVYEHNRLRNHFSTSVLYQDHIYGFDEAFLVCMELRTGKVLWKERRFQKGSLLVADGRLIILGEYGLLALAEVNPREYREIASFPLSQGRCWAMPVLAGGRLYVRDQEHIFCLELRNGQK